MMKVINDLFENSKVEFDCLNGPIASETAGLAHAWWRNHPDVQKILDQGVYTWGTCKIHTDRDVNREDVKRVSMITPDEYVRKGKWASLADPSLMVDEKTFVEYQGLEDSFASLVQKIQTDGPYDAVIGCSFSSTILTAATAWFQQNHGHVPWRFNILCCPFPVRDNAFLAKYMQKKIDFPHIIFTGSRSEFWNYEARALCEYENPQLFLHTDKHRFPRDQEAVLKICQTLLALREPVLSRL